MTDEKTAVAVLEAELAALRREFVQATLASAHAVAKAEVALDRRLDHANDVRSQLTEQAATLATREQVDALEEKFQLLYDRNMERIAEVARRADAISNERVGSRKTVTAFYAAIAAAVGFISLVIVAANLFTQHG